MADLSAPDVAVVPRRLRPVAATTSEKFGRPLGDAVTFPQNATPDGFVPSPAFAAGSIVMRLVIFAPVVFAPINTEEPPRL